MLESNFQDNSTIISLSDEGKWWHVAVTRARYSVAFVYKTAKPSTTDIGEIWKVQCEEENNG